MSQLQTRLKHAGWTLNCQRFIDLGSDQAGTPGPRTCTWRAVKGEMELVVKAKLGQDANALRYLYDVAKAVGLERDGRAARGIARRSRAGCVPHRPGGTPRRTRARHRGR
jgi:hypothetical protein